MNPIQNSGNVRELGFPLAESFQNGWASHPINSEEVSAAAFTGRKISIAGLEKAVVLKYLHDYATGGGHALPADTSNALRLYGENLGSGNIFALDIKDARKYVSNNPLLRFEYVNVRPVKANIRGDFMDPSEYDACNGSGRAESAIRAARNDLDSARKGSSDLETLDQDQLLQLLIDAGIARAPQGAGTTLP